MDDIEALEKNYELWGTLPNDKIQLLFDEIHRIEGNTVNKILQMPYDGNSETRDVWAYYQHRIGEKFKDVLRE